MGKLIGIVVVVLVLVVGLVWWMNRDKSAMGPNEGAMGNGVAANVKEAMGMSQKMKCDYAMDQAGQTYRGTVSTEGEKFKSISQMDGMVTYALYDGATQYMWTSKDTNGFKMDQNCLSKMKEMAGGIPETAGAMAPTDAKASFDMAKEVSCAPVEEVDFSIPTEIVFADQCAMLETK